jgi:hypothetical protein
MSRTVDVAVEPCGWRAGSAVSARFVERARLGLGSDADDDLGAAEVVP